MGSPRHIGQNLQARIAGLGAVAALRQRGGMDDAAATTSRPLMRLWLALVMLLTMAALGLAAWTAPRSASIMAAAGFELPPPSPPPAVEPVELQAVAPETARERNAAVPFVDGPVPPAKPFQFTGSSLDQARATDCLASALYYEAAAEAEDGQRAVAQVVLNRVRHPAFPSSVCGVVYQGATRRTGCQFSFSCDGSMARRPSPALWERLRGLAHEALAGRVYAPVGLATHYHTDWVLPYWSAKLDKLRAERTHLFFRWNGWWGTPPAFRQRYRGAEPLIGRMAGLSSAHATARAGEVPLDVLADGSFTAGPGADALTGLSSTPGTPAYASEAGNFFIYSISARQDAASLADMAKAACGTQPYCKVMMWTDPAITPTSLPVSAAALDAMAFSYLKNDKGAFERALWNCAIFAREDAGQCMKARVPVAATAGRADAEPLREAARGEARPESQELIPMQAEERPQVPEMARPTPREEPSGNMIRRRPGGV